MKKYHSGSEAILGGGDNQSDADLQVRVRHPTPEDGPKITSLIGNSPPLDTNSAYCNLLQCSDFADTCLVAEIEGRPVGWISAYRPPSSPERLFVWQVAVDASARKQGIAALLLEELIALPAAANTAMLTTTITEANAASWRLFEAFAEHRGARLIVGPRFDEKTHFAGEHDTEWEVQITPL